MAKKKKQHYVPKVYLHPFMDRLRPEGWPSEKPFSPAVWVLEPSLEGTPRRRSPGNILWKNSLYTLTSDDPRRPWLEESLSRLESAYRDVREAILAEKPLSTQEYGVLCLFVGAMFGRVPSQIDHWQDQIGRLSNLTKQVVGEDVNGAFFGVEEAGKRSLAARVQGYAEVVLSHGFILVNDTEIGFFTSDRPVSHAFLHPDNLPVALFPAHVRRESARNVEAFFSFMPISPQAAFVSSPLLAPLQSLYVHTEDVQLTLALNNVTRSRAQLIIASTEEPFAGLKERIIAADRAAIAKAKPRSGLMIYTPSDRHWVATVSVKHGIDQHPLHGRLQFVPEDLAAIHAAAGAEEIVEVRIYDAGLQVGGMRECWFRSIPTVSGEAAVIENWPGGWSDWKTVGPDSDGV
jgi:Protein of unknown function (DUF4238)